MVEKGLLLPCVSEEANPRSIPIGGLKEKEGNDGLSALWHKLEEVFILVQRGVEVDCGKIGCEGRSHSVIIPPLRDAHSSRYKL